PVQQGSRDFSACALNPGASFGAGNAACGGSGTSFPGRFNTVNLPITNGNARTIADGAGTIRQFVPATDQFNFAPYNYYRRPSEQYSFAAFAHLDVMPGLRAYGEFNFHDNHTVSQVAAGGLFFGDPIFTASSENPTISNSMRGYLGLGPIGSN